MITDEGILNLLFGSKAESILASEPELASNDWAEAGREWLDEFLRSLDNARRPKD